MIFKSDDADVLIPGWHTWKLMQTPNHDQGYPSISFQTTLIEDAQPAAMSAHRVEDALDGTALAGMVRKAIDGAAAKGLMQQSKTDIEKIAANAPNQHRAVALHGRPKQQSNHDKAWFETTLIVD